MRFLQRRFGELSGYVFILPSFVILGLFLVYPVIWSAVASFKDIRPIALRQSGLFEVPGDLIGLRHYVDALNNPLFQKAVVNTLYFSVIFIPVTMFGSVLLAMLVNRKLPAVHFFRSVFFIPYVISVVSASLIFMFLFNGDRGLVNAVLGLFGASGPN